MYFLLGDGGVRGIHIYICDLCDLSMAYNPCIII